MYKKRSHTEMESTNSDDPQEKGKTGSAADESQQPKKRSIPVRSVTIPFFQRTWEEIPPGKMFYLPTCQNPKYMFDDIMENQFNKYRPLWCTMTISKPKVRISNIIMLQDDLRVQNNTPTDATAFTQVCYLMHFCPQNQKNFFKLMTVDNFTDYTGKDLTYEMEPNISHTQLVQVQGFEIFEMMGLVASSVQDVAGFDPTGAVEVVAQNIVTPYIPPRVQSPLSVLSGNLQPASNVDKIWVPNMMQILLARNLNGLSFHKYGDELNFEIETNLEGVHLLNDEKNNFLAERVINSGTSDYLSEWCYPGRNRPFLSRSANLDPGTDPVTQNKNFKPLQHHFFMMPPILKPNGALLGQRCSFILEQSFEVTFHFPTSLFDTVDPHINVQNFIHQDSAVILRRNFYGKKGLPPVENSYFCGAGTAISCNPGPCPPDTFAGWSSFMTTTISKDDFKQSYTIVVKDPGPEMIHIEASDGFFTNADITTNLPKWLDMLKTGTSLCFICPNGQQQEIDGVPYWVLGSLTSLTGTRYFGVVYRGPETKDNIYLLFDGTDFKDIYYRNGITCATYSTAPERTITKQQAAVYDRNATVFHV